ncbi:MAG: AMP-binding protein [Janthinobacterium lividum]
MAARHRLIDRPDGGPLFHRPGGPVGADGFLRHAHALAAQITALQPGPGGQLVNLCRDRYAFAVAFAAGLILHRTSLLNADLATLGDTVFGTGQACLVLADMPIATALPVLQVAIASHPPNAPPAENPAIPADHLAAIVFTSGSTGQPVAHRKVWAELVARSRAAALQFGPDDTTLRVVPDDTTSRVVSTATPLTGTIIGMVPPQHMYGFETTILLPLHAPVGSWCGPAFYPADLLALPPCPAPRTLVTTPMQLRALLQAGLDLPVDACISATAPLDPALAAAIEQRFGIPVLEIFGATECGSIASRRATSGPDWSLYRGIDLSIAPHGATVRAEGMAPIPLADVLEPVPGGFRLLGRRTDVVKLGGRRASLPGLNQLLAALPGIEDGAFVVPDDLDHRSTARLVAVVVAPHRTDSDILADLRRMIDPVFLPRRLIRVDALPRNALGKLPRQAMLDLVAAAE